MWAHVGKSLNCIIAMVDKLIERDGSGEGDDGSGKDGEKGHSLGDSVITHPQGKESFFFHSLTSKQNEEAKIQWNQKRGVNSALDESADTVFFHCPGWGDGRLFIILHHSCVFRTACNARFCFAFAS